MPGFAGIVQGQFHLFGALAILSIHPPCLHPAGDLLAREFPRIVFATAPRSHEITLEILVERPAAWLLLCQAQPPEKGATDMPFTKVVCQDRQRQRRRATAAIAPLKCICVVLD